MSNSDDPGPFDPDFWMDPETISEERLIKFTRESAAEAESRREEQRKGNAFKRLFAVYVVVLFTFVLFYCGAVIHDPAVSSDVKRWAFGVFTFVLGAFAGFIIPRPTA